MTPPHPASIERSLAISRLEGIPASVMIGVIDYYLIPFGLFLGATTQQIGLLVALPQLLGAAALLFAVKAVGLMGSRLRFIVRGAALQAALLLPVALLAVAPMPWRIGILIGLIIGYRVLMNLVGAAWGSLMSDYLPPERRGRYFGGRSSLVGLAQVSGMALAGLLLFLTKRPAPALGFLLIFLIAALARAGSAAALARMTDLPLAHAPGQRFTFLAFLRRFQESNFVRFTLYVAGITFVTHLAAPYFSVHMLRNLHFNYLTYMAVNLSALGMSLLAFPIWGRHADVVGNARVLKTTSLLVPLLPLVWIVTANPLLLMINEGISGFIWGGFNLCAANFVYDAVTPEKRVQCLGYFNLINGVAIFGGTTLGGWLAERLPAIHGYSLLTLFGLSGVLRLLVHFLLSRHFEEVRHTARKVSSRQLFFSVVGIQPLWGEHAEGALPLWRRFTHRPMHTPRS